MLRVIVSLAVLAPAIYGQQAAPAFEVASIRPSESDSGSSGIRTGHGRLDGINVTLKRCIVGAYGSGPQQIAGGPDWLDSRRFQIMAKATQPDGGDAALMVMLQGLLLDAHRATMDAFAKILARSVDLPVVNRTKLPGSFNLRLEWTPEKVRANDNSAAESPSIFTAIQEQLGLRLGAQKQPIEVLVIDHAELPSEN